MENMCKGSTAWGSLNNVHDNEAVFCNLNKRDISIELNSLNSTGNQNLIVHKLSFNIDRTLAVKNGKFWVRGNYIDIKEISTEWKENVLWATAQEELGDFTNLFNKIRPLSQSIYIPSFRNVINIGGQGKYFDIEIGTEFVKNWRIWKTGNNPRQQRKIQEVNRDIKEIFGFNSLEINDSADGSTLILNINEKSYRLNEIGSGIAQFIVVLVNTKMLEPTFILIDEPELNLHPSLQLKFLMTLGSYAKEGVLFATHSIGLTRSVSERIYSIVKDGNDRAIIHEFDQTPTLSEFLGELSFSGFKDLGFEKILLVEGVNDIKTVQQFLRKLEKDTKIVPLPLGGSQMINASREHELSEILRISDNISALIDSERNAEEQPLSKDRQAFVNICNKLNIDICVLERRSIENYLTQEAIQKIKGASYSALEQYQKLEELNPGWGKAENWRIAKEMSFEEISNTDLGKFLNNL